LSGKTVAAADDRTIDAVGRIISIAYANVRMSEGLNEAAEHERRLTAELRALQELTLLGASTDDLARLAQETIEAVVVSPGPPAAATSWSTRPRRKSIRSCGSGNRAGAGRP
jgi:alcohol dehydrogenase class IV